MRTVQHLPLPMERYGQSNGHNLYRVVWSDSHTWLIGDAGKFHEAPFYPGVSAWMLEKHLSSTEYGGPEQWDTEVLGPYPAEGEWEFCYQFPYQPTDSMISVWIAANKASRALTPQQRKDSIMQPLLERQKRQHQKVDDVFDEAMHGFRNGRTRLISPGGPAEPIHMKRAKRRDDMRLKLSAQDLGMPMTDNSFFTGGRDGTERTGRTEGR